MASVSILQKRAKIEDVENRFRKEEQKAVRAQLLQEINQRLIIIDSHIDKMLTVTQPH